MDQEKIQLPSSELEILQILWDKGPMTSGEIREELYQTRNKEFTQGTVVSLIQRLESKNYIQKTGKQIGKAFVYEAVLQPERAQAHFLKKYFGYFFGSDPVPIMTHLLENSEMSLEELKEIKKKIKEQEQKLRREQS